MQIRGQVWPRSGLLVSLLIVEMEHFRQYYWLPNIILLYVVVTERCRVLQYILLYKDFLVARLWAPEVFGQLPIAAYSCLLAAFATCTLAARHVLFADMSIGSFYSYMCHNSLFTCLFYYILAFVHIDSLLSLPFLIDWSACIAADHPLSSAVLQHLYIHTPGPEWIFRGAMKNVGSFEGLKVHMPFMSSSELPKLWLGHCPV